MWVVRVWNSDRVGYYPKTQNSGEKMTPNNPKTQQKPEVSNQNSTRTWKEVPEGDPNPTFSTQFNHKYGMWIYFKS